MKYLAILLCMCLLLGGCAAQPEPAPQKTTPTEQITPDCLLPPEPSESAPENLVDPPPVEDVPKIPSGTDSTGPAPEIGPEGLPTPELTTNPVFNTENIVGILFYGYYGGGTGSAVPAEHMAEITKWLSSFTVGEPVPELLPPGTNTYFIEIAYADGTVIKQGLDVAEVDGVEYYTVHGQAPECYWDILSRVSLENDPTTPAPEIGPEGLPTPAL